MRSYVVYVVAFNDRGHSVNWLKAGFCVSNPKSSLITWLSNVRCLLVQVKLCAVLYRHILLCSIFHVRVLATLLVTRVMIQDVTDSLNTCKLVIVLLQNLLWAKTMWGKLSIWLSQCSDSKNTNRCSSCGYSNVWKRFSWDTDPIGKTPVEERFC